MKGFADHGDQTPSASEYNPLTFAVIGQALRGKPFEGTALAAQAVHIMTGAPLPEGVDLVVPGAYARETTQGAEVSAVPAANKNLGRLGEDIARGAAVLDGCGRLRPRGLGVLASLGLGD